MCQVRRGRYGNHGLEWADDDSGLLMTCPLSRKHVTRCHSRNPNGRRHHCCSVESHFSTKPSVCIYNSHTNILFIGVLGRVGYSGHFAYQHFSTSNSGKRSEHHSSSVRRTGTDLSLASSSRCFCMTFSCSCCFLYSAFFSSLSCLSRSSRSTRKSGFSSRLVLFNRFTISFTRFSRRILYT